MKLIETTAWNTLAQHASHTRTRHVRELLDDPKRFAQFSCEAEGLLLDYTRQRVDARALELLQDLAANADLTERIQALLRGDAVNNTENRPALHTALRRDAKRPLVVGGRDLMKDVAAERARLDAFVHGVHSGAISGSAGQPFRTLVNIGIGGSDLGPVMAVEALARFRNRDLDVRFVSNIDGCQIADVVASVDPARTLFVICSKTFTTLETMS
ncbi:MAG: glucose-6-phosphate isomerase, partial [Steroidobacteraceae bacterium]